MTDPEERYVPLEEASKHIDLDLFPRDDATTAVEADRSYSFPVTTGAEYRGWYRITAGPDKGKALWVPKWSRYLGPRPSGKHGGSDLFGVDGTDLVALAAGTIEWRKAKPDWGNHIYLYHQIEGVRHIAVYAHLDASGAFKDPKAVKKGEVIGKVGCTGNAGNGGACWRDATCHGATAIEDHLHLELLELDGAGQLQGKKDPVATYGWTVKYADDDSQKVCGKKEQLL